MIPVRHLKQFAQIRLRIKWGSAIDIPVRGDVGQALTQHLVELNFWWMAWYSDVLPAVCLPMRRPCQHVLHYIPAGLLPPLAIPAQKGQIGMDLITACQ
jgi:hypothetical protein